MLPFWNLRDSLCWPRLLVLPHKKPRMCLSPPNRTQILTAHILSFKWSPQCFVSPQRGNTNFQATEGRTLGNAFKHQHRLAPPFWIDQSQGSKHCRSLNLSNWPWPQRIAQFVGVANSSWVALDVPHQLLLLGEDCAKLVSPLHNIHF